LLIDSIPTMSGLKLYFNAFCPFTQRTTIALAELGLLSSITDLSKNKGVEVVPIDLQNKPAWYLQDVNPAGKVPVLELVGHADDPSRGGKNTLLFESDRITEFLSLEYGDKRLFPSHAIDVYNMRKLMEFFGGYNTHSYGMLRAQEKEKQEEAKAKLLDFLKEFSKLIKGPYLLGEKFSLGDCLIAPFLVRLPVLQHYRSFEIPQTPAYQKFNEYLKNLQTRESVKSTTAAMDALVHHSKGYAEGTK